MYRYLFSITRTSLKVIFQVIFLRNFRQAAMSSPETSSLSRRALNFAVVRMVNCICFPFSRIGIYTKFCPRPLYFSSVAILHQLGRLFVESSRSVSESNSEKAHQNSLIFAICTKNPNNIPFRATGNTPDSPCQYRLVWAFQ